MEAVLASPTTSVLHRPPRGGLIPKGQLQEEFTDLAAGRWAHLLEQSRRCAEQAAGIPAPASQTG